MSDHRRMDIGAMLNNDEEENCLVRPAQSGVETKGRNPFFTSKPSRGNTHSRPELTICPLPARHPSLINFDPKLSISSKGTYLKEDRETDSLSSSPYLHWPYVMTATRLPPMKLDLHTCHQSKFAANPTIIPPIQLAVPWGSHYPSPHCDNPEHSYHACEPQPLPRRRRSPSYSAIGRNKQPHSNKLYNREQVHLIRYFKVDCEKKFEEIVDIWLGIWPRQRPLTRQSVSSRSYRDNIRPLWDKNGDWVVIDGNRAIMVTCKIREKNMPENKHVPDTLVGRHPDMVLKYSWTSQKHKDDARALMVEDAAKPNSKGAVCRKLLKLWNNALIDKENQIVGGPTDSYSFLILLKNENKEIERLCDCNAAKILRGHSDYCRVWEHPTMKRCSCRYPIRSLTTHHLPECGSLDRY